MRWGLGWWVACLAACASSRSADRPEDGGRPPVDAAIEDAGSPDGGPPDGGTCETVCFTWDPRTPIDPWEDAPPRGVGCGEELASGCPAGTRCGVHGPTGLEACLPEGDTLPLLRLDFPPGDVGAVPVTLRLRLNEGELPAPRGGRGLLLERDGVDAVRLPLPAEGAAAWSLRLAPGTYAVTLYGLDVVGGEPAMIAPRTGRLEVAAAGSADVPIAAREVAFTFLLDGAAPARPAPSATRFVSAWGGVSEDVPRWLEPAPHVAELTWAHPAAAAAGLAVVRFDVSEGEGAEDVVLDSRTAAVDGLVRVDGVPLARFSSLTLEQSGRAVGGLRVEDEGRVRGSLLVGRPYTVLVDGGPEGVLGRLSDAWEPPAALVADLETVDVQVRVTGPGPGHALFFEWMREDAPADETRPPRQALPDATGRHRIRLPAGETYRVVWRGTAPGHLGVASESYVPSPELWTIETAREGTVRARVTLDGAPLPVPLPIDAAELRVVAELAVDGAAWWADRVAAEVRSADGVVALPLRGGPFRLYVETPPAATQLVGRQLLAEAIRPEATTGRLDHALVARNVSVQRLDAGAASPGLVEFAQVAATHCVDDADAPGGPCLQTSFFDVEANPQTIRVLPGLIELSWLCGTPPCITGPRPHLRVLVP